MRRLVVSTSVAFTDDDLEAAQRIALGRAVLARTADVLGRVGVVPVALKGVVLSSLAEDLSPPAPARPMADVDVLVAPGERARAERALDRAGFARVWRTRVATTLRDPELGMDLDLHERLVEPELFRLDVTGLLERALRDDARFGFPVRVLERHDLYAHLVAHFVRNRSNARDLRHVADLALVARALPMESAALAAHLDRTGLARAGRYALGIAAEAGDGFAAEVVARLPPDPRGEILVRGARRWLARFEGNDPRATPAVHALNATIPRGASSLVTHAALGVTSRARRMFQRRPVAP